MSSEREVRRTLRRLKLAERTTPLKYRGRSELPYLETASASTDLLLDTTVYIDELRGKSSYALETALRTNVLWHSSVTEGELATLAGLLDPRHPDTPHAIDRLIASIERRSPHRIVNPDCDIWRYAGILAGMLARLQQYGKPEHRKALNDALLFLSAINHGLTVLTRNTREFDLLLQLEPQGKVVFYEV